MKLQQLLDSMLILQVWTWSYWQFSRALSKYFPDKDGYLRKIWPVRPW